MSQVITIDPVTRIEGHAKVLISQADDGSIESAAMVVNELRGFERILVGMQAERMPLVTARICGVCPSAHHLAAVKALENAFGVEPPPAGKAMRELLYMGHYIHSHVLSLFVLQGPDLVLGIDSDPAKRNVVGLVEAAPEVATKALRLRTLGQKINESIGGRGVHPVTAVTGGMAYRLTEERRVTLEKWVDESMALVTELAGVAKQAVVNLLDKHPDLLTELTIPTCWYMGTVNDGKPNFYDGKLRVLDPEGKKQIEFDVRDYRGYLMESAVEWSYMKPVYLNIEQQARLYRVNTLARINIADSMETPIAQAELETFRAQYGRPCHYTVMHAYARVIELLYACEKAKALVSNREILGESRVPAKIRASQGIGHVEAPRGTLIHDYEIDAKGVVRAANLIVATQQNYAAINATIMQAAGSYVAKRGDDPLLNAVEFAIRCYDPCLSCATHAVGQMPLEIHFKRGSKVVRKVGRAL